MKELDEAKAAIAKDAATRAARPQQTPLSLAAYTAGTYERIALWRMVWTLSGGHLPVTIGVASCDAEVYDGTKRQFRVELTIGGEVVTFGVPPSATTPARLKYDGYVFELVR